MRLRTAGQRHRDRDLEFTQVGSVWPQLGGRNRSGHRAAPAGRVTVDALRVALRPETRVLALGSVQWTNGYRADLAAIGQLCRECGVWLVADAVQQLGAIPLDVSRLPVDVLVCGGHKWLNAPFGAGLLHFTPTVRERLRTPLSGYPAVECPDGDWDEHLQTAGIGRRRRCRSHRRPPVGERRRRELPWCGRACGQPATGAGARNRDHSQVHRRAHRQLIGGLDRLGVSVITPREAHVRSGIITFSVGSSAAKPTP
ncbi:aminotransferase class V-fold PLP-dependent enzyme [Streptomyces sp. NPDC006314]|uniref:aminotransferase class V-fold PLP-dependent enzyme n=1 Tax=Streptomyces sp. NPDC006314 TaxID=3154475 RepID=UPI0033A0408B